VGQCARDTNASFQQAGWDSALRCELKERHPALLLTAIRAQSRTKRRLCRRFHTRICAQTYVHAHSHAHTHIPTHTHAHTHTHIHVQAFFEAGMAWREAKQDSMAFVMLNRFLDLCDAMDDPESTTAVGIVFVAVS